MSPKLSIMVGTYGTKETNSQRYLDLCLKSLKRQTFQDFELIIVSSGSHYPKINWYIDGSPGQKFKASHTDSQVHFPEAMKKAYSMTNPESEMILILNDDTILSKTCLEELVKCPPQIIANPLCNSDLGRRYSLTLGIHTDDGIAAYDRPQYVYEDAAHLFEDIVERSITYPPGLLHPEWTAFFCTLVHRKTYDLIGGIDPKFQTGKDDVDFCLRARKLGFVPSIMMSAFVFHFGGATADKHLTDESRAFNEAYWKDKWGSPNR